MATSVPTSDEPSSSKGSRKKWIAVGAAVLVLAALGWLFWGEGSEPEPPTNINELARVDGTLNQVDPDKLVMTPFQPLDGKTQVEFQVPEKYRSNFDLAHLRSHSAVGIPTRIYYIPQDGQYLAVYKADAPANSKPTESAGAG